MKSHDKFTGHNPEPVEEQEPTQAQPVVMSTVPVSVSHAVETIPVSAPHGGAHTLTLGAFSTAELLIPNDPKRRSAIVLAVDNPVYLATSLEEAQSSSGTTNGTAGFYLPAGIPLPIPSSSPFWAAPTTTGSPSRVSVMTFRD